MMTPLNTPGLASVNLKQIPVGWYNMQLRQVHRYHGSAYPGKLVRGMRWDKWVIAMANNEKVKWSGFIVAVQPRIRLMSVIMLFTVRQQ